MTRLSGGRRATHSVDMVREVDPPLVSVITAAYNAGNTITPCIESVAAQASPLVEHIVIDGGSTDATVGILKEHSDMLELWISEPDKGIYDAWNKGLALARGKWIAFLGADDMYMADAIQKYINLAEINPTAEFLSSRAKLIHPAGISPEFGAEWQWPACSRRLTTINVGTFHKRTLFERYGVFDTSYRSAADYEFLLRAGKNLNAAYMQDVTVSMRAGGASETTANLHERRRAKIERRVRSTVLATSDLVIDVLRFHARRLLIQIWAGGKRRNNVNPGVSGHHQ